MQSSQAFRKEINEKILDAEKLKNCFECGICTASCSMAEMLGNECSPRRLLEDIYYDLDKALSSEGLWLCAWCYRCHNRCPQGLRIPEIFLFVRAIAAKRGQTEGFERAIGKIARHIPLPLVTTLVCFHPERAGMKSEEVLGKIETIRRELLKTVKKKERIQKTKGKIAVVGSGPAGLTVAHELVRMNHDVTVFEALSEPGGMLRKGIPHNRLPREAVSKEIQFIKDLGVDIRTNVKIGKNMLFDDLKKEGYRTFFIGTGAHKSHKLKVEGSDLKGVINALDFLWRANSGENPDVGKKVIVIGGGNVAVDAARTVRCLGAEQVTILYRRGRDEMPANEREAEEAEQEGIKIELLAAPTRILGEKGSVCGIECVKTQLDEPDETGRRKAVPVKGSEFKRETDMVILAIGEAPELGFLPKEVELNDDGTLWADPVTMETSLQGVFGGGDAVNGPASVIEAIRDGKRAATSIDDYLKRVEAS